MKVIIHAEPDDFILAVRAGQRTPRCLSHMSVRTSNGQCPERVLIWGQMLKAVAAGRAKLSKRRPVQEVLL